MAVWETIAGWMWYSAIFILSAVLILFACYCLYIKYVHQKYDHIPGPPRESFLLGHGPIFVEQTKKNTVLHEKLLEWTEKYGPVYRLNFLHYVTVMTVDPEATKEILMSPKYPKDPTVYKRLFNLFGQRFLGNGLVTVADHDLWYKQRRIMDPAFSSSYLRGLMGIFNEKAERLMVKLAEMADKQTPAHMHGLVNCVTLDVITKAAFGVDLDMVKNNNLPFPNAIELCLKGMVYYLRDPVYEFLPWNRKVVQDIKEAAQLLRRTGRAWINERKKAMENGEDVPKDILTQILKSAEETKFDDDSQELMLDNFVTFFIAGQETTANQLSFAIMELGKHPEIMKRLKAEVDEVLGKRQEILYEDLGKLTYLSQVLKETLRLYPTAPATSRWVADDMVIDGIKIPGGFVIIFDTYVTGRMDRFFKDPLTFDPKRFDLNAPKPYFCYFPFALGPRSCLGQAFSQMEAKVVMAKLLQRFDYSLVPGQPLDIEDIGTLRPRGGVICRMKQCD
ncbi:cholesterol 24-hydroxylase-like [Chanos chanos]|uniref:Cholesterol 24-hydroxylase n=1 Tax=Chanos chanos TaxID=29144 RepID=A0A6J2V8C9_CHACN|nr:cholesterol 24-hydroxylase-like [Chanos chanos]